MFPDKIVIVCTIVMKLQGIDPGNGAEFRIPEIGKCYSENDVVPEELVVDDATTRSLATRVEELVKKMEVEKIR